MSYTLKKLKQSEIDHGYHKPTDVNNTNNTYGTFVACFVIVLSFFLVLLNFGKDQAPQQDIKTSQTLNNKVISKKFTIENKEVEVTTSSKNEETSKIGNKDSNTLTIAKPITDQPEPLNSSNTTDNIDIAKITPQNELTSSIIDNSSETKELPPINNVETKDTNIELSTISKEPIVQDDEVNQDKDITFQNQEEMALLDNQPVSWEDLSESFKNSMPEIKINAIAFLDNEEERYILMNMTKYRVNDLISDTGPSIEKINQHSVIMNSQGRLFKIYLNEGDTK